MEGSYDACEFYLQHKRRFCKLRKNVGIYCTEHSVLSDTNGLNSRKRIPCPLDTKHSVFEDELEKHLKKCNSRTELLPSCYKKEINCGNHDGSDPLHYEVTLRKVEEHEVLDVIAKCQKLYTEHIRNIETDVLFHDVMRQEYENPKNGASANRHILQQASLIGHMDRLAFLADDRCYMEFGCGKAGLSHWVQQSVKDKANIQFVLVDKSSVRYKMDQYHRGVDQGPTFERIKIDIEHMDIREVTNLNNDRQIVTIGKHLCGAATDLMIRCLTRLEPHANYKRAITGIVLAMCCHHRCHWKSYVGKEFIEKQCGLTARQFHILCSMSSWATCSTRPVQENTTEEAPAYSHPRSGNLLPQQREAIGNQCKQLIDYGRAQYLKQFGFTCEIKTYIEKCYTLENYCLLAKRDGS